MYSDLLYRHSLLFKASTYETHLARFINSTSGYWQCLDPLQSSCKLSVLPTCPKLTSQRSAHIGCSHVYCPPILPDQQGGMATVLLLCLLYSPSTQNMRGAARALAEYSLLLL